MTDDLITWLRAQLIAHERNICPDPRDCQRMFHTADQNFMLDDIAAKRRILGWLAEVAGIFPIDHELVARNLAAPYADRPGYREEWRP